MKHRATWGQARDNASSVATLPIPPQDAERSRTSAHPVTYRVTTPPQLRTEASVACLRSPDSSGQSVVARPGVSRCSVSSCRGRGRSQRGTRAGESWAEAGAGPASLAVPGGSGSLGPAGAAGDGGRGRGALRVAGDGKPGDLLRGRRAEHVDELARFLLRRLGPPGHGQPRQAARRVLGPGPVCPAVRVLGRRPSWRPRWPRG